MHPCLNCSAELVGHACKIRCPRCGYFESCSDLEPHPPRESHGEEVRRPPSGLRSDR